MAGLLRAVLDRSAGCARTTAPRRRCSKIKKHDRREAMNDITPSAYGALTGPAELTIQRLLPGPIERVWAYLTDSDLRKQWLASGDMQMSVGAPFEFVWRNDELSNPPAKRPEGFSAEHRMQSEIVEVDPPRKITFTWAPRGEVTFELKP